MGEVGRGWGILGKEAHGRKRERGAGLMGKWREGRKPVGDERKIVVERGMKMHRQGLGHYREEGAWKEGERSRFMRKGEGVKEAHGPWRGKRRSRWSEGG